LPTDTLFCPRLACSVYDHIYRGFGQPLIGTFSLPIGELMHALKKERKEETEAIEDIVEKIQKIIDDGLTIQIGQDSARSNNSKMIKKDSMVKKP
jgi:hypothetical protein